MEREKVERENTFNQHGEGKSRETERMHSINMERKIVERENTFNQHGEEKSREREYIQSTWRGKK